MLNRKELEGILGYKLTDEQWNETCQALNNAAEREWEENHPLED